MDSLLYPTFTFIEQRGQYIPYIRVPRNFEELVPRFYEQNRKLTVEEYARQIEEKFLEGKLEIRLNWDEEFGLRNISVGPSGGLDLDERSCCFQEHNLGTKTGTAAGFIGLLYVSELLKSAP